ncbi:hypothetical protein PORCRE_1223 [Porphyromonas crevioricanis JCM 15906]|uniref:Uncharacterized protein n=1 Tax=Porphyromonas crevioricanis JCM 15906 TaxID=1305617 RepID=T1DT01_9PORP|nr:hypothetical protein PORCRE_1223 [Porphyromonas crevioricanis JCM 15906]
MKSGDCRGGYKDLHDDLSYFFSRLMSVSSYPLSNSSI